MGMALEGFSLDAKSPSIIRSTLRGVISAARQPLASAHWSHRQGLLGGHICGV